MPKRILLLAMLLWCIGCAGPALTSRVVQEETSWFVRLDSYQDPGNSSVRYEHPATWTAEDLLAILSRLLLEERGGLMDSARPPHSVFSTEEITVLVQAIRDSFRMAKPSEWVAFSISTPSDSGLAVTSGGMFLTASRLHLIVANHRALVAQNSEELASVRANPLHSLRGSGGILTFESSRFVMGRQSNWSGGHRASASELVLDHRGFLSFLKLAGTTPVPAQVPGSSGPAVVAESGASPARSSTGGDSDPNRSIIRLQEEVERLKKQVAEQAAEIERLNRRIDHFSRSTPSP